MHPGQYTVLNSPRPKVLEASLAELAYHARVLDLLGLDRTIRDRLVVENDERLYTLDDCFQIHTTCGIPILFDACHHELNPDGRSLPEAPAAAVVTWGEGDGLPMVDYSSPLPARRTGSHAHALDAAHFCRFLGKIRPHYFDLMLKVRDKERSALLAARIVSSDPRFVRTV